MFAAGMAVGSRDFRFLAVCQQKVDNFTRTANDIVNAVVPPVKTLKLFCCPKGCSTVNSRDRLCPVCGEAILSKHQFFYMPLRDKLKRLIDCDLSRLLMYDQHRKPPHPNHVDDFLDSDACRNIKAMARPNHVVIFVELVIDGALIFNKGMAKMEPVTVSILSLPEPLRHVMHVGIHVTVLQTGGLRAIYELMASEMCYLWNTGMNVIMNVAIFQANSEVCV
jgi:hypothetical protein